MGKKKWGKIRQGARARRVLQNEPVAITRRGGAGERNKDVNKGGGGGGLTDCVFHLLFFAVLLDGVFFCRGGMMNRPEKGWVRGPG